MEEKGEEEEEENDMKPRKFKYLVFSKCFITIIVCLYPVVVVVVVVYSFVCSFIHSLF